MLTRCFLTAALSLVVVGAASSDVDWALFKKMFNKAYDDAVEEQTRRQIWEANVRDVKAHNEMYARGESSYFQEVNQFTDMTTDDIIKTRTGYRPRQDLVLNPPPSYKSGKYRDILPKTVDWRKKGYVTPVKDQGSCGSCWAFSTTGGLEGQHFRKTGKLVSLSESNLVDCSGKFGTNGCEGGWMDEAFKYVISNKGIDTETSYPYVPRQRKCQFNNSTIGSTDISFKTVTNGSEDELQKAVAMVGPISVALDASYFGAYKGGVLDQPECSPTNLNHAVLVVGYGTYQGTDYWLVKNSWGASWGLNGYIRMIRNKNNQCGIASKASYPVM